MSVTAVVAVITLIVGGFGDSAGDFRPLLQIVVRAWLHVCFMVSIIGVGLRWCFGDSSWCL